MPLFTPKPPVLEARSFDGGEASALDIQGWLLAANVQSKHNEGDEETITFNGKTLTVGEWVLKDGDEFRVLTASELYSNYTQA